MCVAVGRQFGTATHCVWRIFICRKQLVGIGRDSGHSDNQQQSRCGEEPSEFQFPVLVHAQAHKQCDYIDEDDDCQVICDLNMVGLDLHAERKGKKHSPQHCLRQPAFPVAVLLVAVPRFLEVALISSFARIDHSQSRSVSEYKRCQHPREICDRLHLCVVSHLDDLHVV